MNKSLIGVVLLVVVVAVGAYWYQNKDNADVVAPAVTTEPAPEAPATGSTTTTP